MPNLSVPRRVAALLSALLTVASTLASAGLIPERWVVTGTTIIGALLLGVATYDRNAGAGTQQLTTMVTRYLPPAGGSGGSLTIRTPAGFPESQHAIALMAGQADTGVPLPQVVEGAAPVSPDGTPGAAAIDTPVTDH